MGLFDFVKDAGGALGSKVFDLTHDDEDITKPTTISPERLNHLRKASIERTVGEMNLNIEQFNAEVDGELVTITGTAPNQEAIEKATLACGNQHGIGQVDCQLALAETPTSAAPADAKPSDNAQPSQFYTVQSGDTLSKIAKELLGSASRYMAIFEANQPMLENPDKIYVGQTLRIPQA
ncbi:peptidoglycan-binding protein LysM [Halioxenophilus aromaticivorans]|uniref:Potassium binding protein Kbp n=1 Tax=Halioxenophilus aromaticivorans TaxID=1306992 RepID=A0AAV3U2F9_9ALTE